MEPAADAPATVLHGHVSRETAHLTFAYPFGSNKCVRREWLEYATSGGGKGQYRFVYQTTDRPFNYAYTERIERDGQEAADAWARAAAEGGGISDGRSPGSYHWNAPKAGTYVHLAVLLERRLAADDERLGVTHAGLSLHAGPTEFERFRAAYGPQLDEAETKRLGSMETFSRRLNPTTWREYDERRALEAERVPERAPERDLGDERDL